MADLRTRLAAYSIRLREFAARVEEESRLYPQLDPQIEDVLLLQCEGLRGMAASLERDAVAAEQAPLPTARLAPPPAAAKLRLVVTLEGAPPPEAVEQFAVRLRAVFRASDLLVGKGPREWEVRFDGPLQALKVRCAQLDAWIRGRYTLSDGSSSNVSATLTIVQD